MLILGQKSCILGPTIFKIPQPNWHNCPYCAALFPHTSLYTMYIVHTILLPQKWYRKTKQKLIYFLSWLFCYKLLEYLSSLKKTQIKRHFHSKSAGDFFSSQFHWNHTIFDCKETLAVLGILLKYGFCKKSLFTKSIL